MLSHQQLVLLYLHAFDCSDSYLLCTDLYTAKFLHATLILSVPTPVHYLRINLPCSMSTTKSFLSKIFHCM